MENTLVTLPVIVCAGTLGIALIGLALLHARQARRRCRQLEAIATARLHAHIQRLEHMLAGFSRHKDD